MFLFRSVFGPALLRKEVAFFLNLENENTKQLSQCFQSTTYLKRKKSLSIYFIHYLFYNII